MDRRLFLTAGLTALGGSLGACAMLGGGGPWTTLVDGATMRSLDGFTQIGEGNWSFVDGTLQGRNGKLGYLITKDSYTDFEIRAEFWADDDANSGLFLRCQDRNKVGADNSYEVNIFDKRPDQTYATAAIVDVAKVRQPAPKAGGKWNTFEITARGDRLKVVFNGETTVDVSDRKWRSGPLALQSAGGTIRFRKVQIRAL